jgi:chlorite dismutase
MIPWWAKAAARPGAPAVLGLEAASACVPRRAGIHYCRVPISLKFLAGQMEDRALKSLNHFSVFRFTEEYWRLGSADRREIHRLWFDGLGEVTGLGAVHRYQLFPTEPLADLMLWCAVEVDSNEAPARFFEGFAQATVPHRRYVEPRISLWGLTKRSQYSKSRSRQEVDPFGGKRAPYLIIYPFTKTADWYMMNQEARQGMMNEHIRIGKQYESIKQLLLYSFGLQDQEFVVVYETDDLAVFSQLVNDLRMTEARRFTLGDTPVHTAVYHTPEEALSIWC